MTNWREVIASLDMDRLERLAANRVLDEQLDEQKNMEVVTDQCAALFQRVRRYLTR